MTAAAKIDFSPQQVAALRRFCGLRPGDRELRAGDLLVVLEATGIWAAESARLAAETPDRGDEAYNSIFGEEEQWPD